MTPNLNLVNQVLRSARAVPAPRLARLPAGKFGAPPIVKAASVANAGMFGASADLPGDSGGPIEPGLLPGTELPSDAFNDAGPIHGNTQGGRIPSWGGRGPWAVESGSVEVNAGDHSTPFGDFRALPNENWLGGSITGIDPNTGKPVYNPQGYGPMRDLEGYGERFAMTNQNTAGTGGANYPGKWGFGANYWVF